jgi:mono/diheme cytochrome c family protein
MKRLLATVAVAAAALSATAADIDASKLPPASDKKGVTFAKDIQPLFERSCYKCHGAEKQKGDYRMDTFAALLTGGKSGKPAITPGDTAKSELLQRLLLDRTDEKAMPPKKKTPLKPAEVALLRWWIKQGAARDTLIAAVKDAPPEVAALLGGPTTAEAPTRAAVYRPRVGDYTALQSEIAALAQKLGVKITPVSRRAGDGLILRTRGAEPRFGDAELAQLARVAPFIVEAEFAGTRLTDAALATLKSWAHLERLDLGRTALTGKTLGELSALKNLSYLNLCSTAVTDETLTALAGSSALRQLYLFDSRVTAAGRARLRTALPQVVIGDLAGPP